jgi:hypothetical protein
MWGALSDERTGLWFTIAAGPRPRSQSRSESHGTRDHILLSQIRDYRLYRFLRLARLRWRYSTTPPDLNVLLYSASVSTETCSVTSWSPTIRLDGNAFVNSLPSNRSHSLMELSPSREAAICAATQEIPSILRNPMVHYRVHKSPPLVPILSQINPILTILCYLSKIHFNLRLGLSSGLLPSGFPTSI